MTTLDEVHQMALKLPGTQVSLDRFGLSVPVKGKMKGYAWTWAERVNPKKPKVINDGVLAVVVPNLEMKEMLLAMDEPKFFTEPHYNGFPAILVRLEAIDAEELEDLLVEAWRCKAPADLIAQYNG